MTLELGSDLRTPSVGRGKLRNGEDNQKSKEPHRTGQKNTTLLSSRDLRSISPQSETLLTGTAQAAARAAEEAETGIKGHLAQGYVDYSLHHTNMSR